MKVQATKLKFTDLNLFPSLWKATPSKVVQTCSYVAFFLCTQHSWPPGPKLSRLAKLALPPQSLLGDLEMFGGSSNSHVSLSDFNYCSAALSWSSL